MKSPRLFHFMALAACFIAVAVGLCVSPRGLAKNTAAVSAAPFNTAPTITPFLNISSQAGSHSIHRLIATVSDVDQAVSTLQVAVNGQAKVTVNGVTVQLTTINNSGGVSAHVWAECDATQAQFLLRVTDNSGAFAVTTLTVKVTPNTPPSVSYPSQVTMTAGTTKTVNPLSGPSDNGGYSLKYDIVPEMGGSLSTGSGAITFINPTNGGAHTVTVTMKDFCGLVHTTSFTVIVTPQVQLCANTLTPQQAYFPSAAASTGTVALTTNPANCSWAAGSNVAWLSITSGASGVGNGTVAYAVQANNTNNFRVGILRIGGQEFTVTQGTGQACAAITLNQGLLPVSSVGQNYNLAFTASGGAAPYTFALAGGALPGALNLAANGNLSGTLTESGTFNFTVKATDANGCTGTRAYAVTVNPVVQPCSFTLSPQSQSFTAAAGTGTVSVTAGANCNWTAASNAAWLSISSGASGAGNGTVAYAVQANNTNNSRTGTLTIGGQPFTVNQATAQACATITVNPSSLPALVVGKPFNQTLTASGGNAPYSFAVTGGIIPAGINLNGQGALTGTPTIAGDTSFTVTATDANGCKGTRTYNVTIQPRSFTSVSAASYVANPLASEMIVAGFGLDLATQTAVADTLPLPLQLAGVSVRVRDSQGIERMAPLFFVSPGQVNYLMPAGTAPGFAHVTLTNGANLLSEGDVTIATVAPGIFTANATGAGFAAAQVVRVKPNGQQIYEEVVKFDPAAQQPVAVPVDLTIAGDQVVLVLYGTGLRGRSALNAVTLTLPNAVLPAGYAGATVLAGFDQVNALLPNSLAGSGECNLTLTVDGRAANTVKLMFK